MEKGMRKQYYGALSVAAWCGHRCDNLLSGCTKETIYSMGEMEVAQIKH